MARPEPEAYRSQQPRRPHGHNGPDGSTPPGRCSATDSPCSPTVRYWGRGDTRGSSTRLASRAQRSALRGLSRECASPGCGVGYDHCKLHHIIWWRHGGRTDLDNLVPVCAKHHSNIHHDGWVIELGPNRELTLRLPDGTIHNTGPPTRNAV